MSKIYRYSPENGVRENILTFEQVDNIPYIDENGNILDHKNLERSEQLIARSYISSTDSVLELGGRFGTVSCIINNILHDPFKHIVIEPDETVIPCLLENRKNHNAYFTVYRNIICNQPKTLIYAGHSTRAVDCSCKENTAPSMALSDVINYHGFGFTALVADCEGCMEGFISNHIDFIKTLRLVTYEQDFGELCNYSHVANMLTECGFICILEGFHTIWIKK